MLVVVILAETEESKLMHINFRKLQMEILLATSLMAITAFRVLETTNKKNNIAFKMRIT